MVFDYTSQKRTAPSASPKALAKKFVEAYLNKDMQTMLKISTNKNIKRLQSIDDKVKEAFEGMYEYKEKIYMNGLKAVSSGITKIKGKDIEIIFNFTWIGNRWVLKEVL